MKRALRGVVLAVSAAAVGMAVTVSPAFACPSCFGRAEGPLVDAARLGMWLLLAVTVGLQAAFVLFFLYLRRRAAKAAGESLDEEWSRLQRGWGRKGILEP